MPELRKDPIIGRWVIIATERAKRPSDFISQPQERMKGFCPFCVGNEDKTPPEVLAYRQSGTRPNTPGWSVRVVPNKFPALKIEGELDKRAVGLYDQMNGVGAHEVIIETPDHDLSLANLPLENFAQVIQAYQDRVIDLKRDPRFQYVLIFKNHGHAAGASLDHSHSQLIALPVIPKRVVEEIRGTNTYYLYRDRCIICDIIHQELEMEVRLIDQNQHFIALAPFASRFPFETWVIPKGHAVYFEAISQDQLWALAQILKCVLQRITTALNDPPYNFLIHSAPFYEKEIGFYHWHMEIIPKLTAVAGFEWGTGFYINPTPPEEACRFLREVKI
ncbi:MAG: galactose-1-phosphate uridylyltransferase [bacterium]|nr:galactose-1-phosphate uridylyltransferase [bacterium]